MIDQKLHQIWLQGLTHFQQTNAEEYQWSQRLQELFPHWSYELWDDDLIQSLIHQTYPSVIPLYENSPNLSFKTDLGRFVILYHFGGVYLDTDIIPIRYFGHFFTQDPEVEFVALQYDSVNAFEKWGMQFNHNTCIMASSSQSIVIRDILDALVQFGPFKKQIHDRTMYNRECILRNYHNVIEKYKASPKMLLISNTVLEPLHACNQQLKCSSVDECRKTFPAAYAIHVGNGSWMQGIDIIRSFGKFYGYVRDSWQIVSIVLLCFLVLFIVLFGVAQHQLRQLRCSLPTDKASYHTFVSRCQKVESI